MYLLVFRTYDDALCNEKKYESSHDFCYSQFFVLERTVQLTILFSNLDATELIFFLHHQNHDQSPHLLAFLTKLSLTDGLTDGRAKRQPPLK